MIFDKIDLWILVFQVISVNRNVRKVPIIYEFDQMNKDKKRQKNEKVDKE